MITGLGLQVYFELPKEFLFAAALRTMVVERPKGEWVLRAGQR